MAAFALALTPVTSYKVENDSYDCYKPTVAIQDGVNGPVAMIGVAYLTRSFDYYCANIAAREAFQLGLKTSGSLLSIVGVTYVILSAPCSEAIFTGDLDAAVPAWKYHIELMRSIT